VSIGFIPTDGVHFTEAGSAALGAAVARTLNELNGGWAAVG
jgi:lysophospholipase L1-like esterase